jgi:transposase
MEKVKIIRVDDVTVLYNELKSLKISEIVDSVIKDHGNWVGISSGETVLIWLCYLLSEGKHQISHVEDWVLDRLELFQYLSKNKNLSEKSFTDDKIETILEHISKPDVWINIEKEINKNSLEVYRFECPESLPTYRVDSAPMNGYRQVREGGLFQKGFTKHHNPNLPLFKIMLCVLDNAVNNVGYPVGHLTFPGNETDDAHYIGIIQHSHKCMPSQYRENNLYVGDKKLSSKANRTFIVSSNNAYLCPLSRTIVSNEMLSKIVGGTPESHYQKIYNTEIKNGKEEKILVAEGFEQVIKMEGEHEKKKYEWEERRLFVRSTAYAESQKKSLEVKLIKAEWDLTNLFLKKKSIKTPESAKKEIERIIQKHKVEGLLQIELLYTTTEKEIRAHKDRPKRTEVYYTFNVKVTRDKVQIADKKALMGFMVYATNALEADLGFEDCVWKYRHQSRIERRFHDIRNKIVPLLPIYLQKDNRIEALINVLILSLKLCAAMEFKAASAIKKKAEPISGLYEGNPRKKTATPAATRMLSAFEGISIVLFFSEGKLINVLSNEIKPVHRKVLTLLGIKEDILDTLPEKIKFFFQELTFDDG